MTRAQAKQILLLYRPWAADAKDPEVARAMAVARQDPELGSWFKQHLEFQRLMHSKLRNLKVPPRPPKPNGLECRSILFPAVWLSRTRPIWLTESAIVLLLASLATV